MNKEEKECCNAPYCYNQVVKGSIYCRHHNRTKKYITRQKMRKRKEIERRFKGFGREGSGFKNKAERG